MRVCSEPPLYKILELEFSVIRDFAHDNVSRLRELNGTPGIEPGLANRVLSLSFRPYSLFCIISFLCIFICSAFYLFLFLGVGGWSHPVVLRDESWHRAQVWVLETLR